MPARLVKLVSFLFVATGAGCFGGEDNADPELDLVDGKADFAEAQPLGYGVPATGQVNGRAFSLFSLDVDGNDQLDVVVRRTSGDFDPRSVVYSSTLDSLDHVPGSFERFDGGNRKSFHMGGQATSILILVRADHYQGSGELELTVECTGGPCAGEEPVGGGELTEVSICLQRARQCAFAQLDHAGISDRDGAAALLAQCLASQTGCGPEMCDTPALDGESPRAVCDGVAGALVFYAGQPAECRRVVSSCMDDCLEMEENSHFLEYDDDELEFWMTGEAMCWLNQYGTACDGLARDHEACGGSEHREIDGVETAGTCFARWRATEGAWLEFEDDNIDCSHVCDAVEEECGERCETDDPDLWADCFRDCATDHPLLADDDYSLCDL